MLSSHPDLVVPPECGFVAWLHPQFGRWQSEDFADAAGQARFVASVVASRKFETWGLSRACIADAVAARRPRDFGDACDAIYRLFCTTLGKPAAQWGDKNNHYLAHIDTLTEVFPRARFIHIVRDGRDVACSYREVMNLPSDSPYRPRLPVAIGDIARQWAGDIERIRESLQALPADAVIELRYEDLVADAQAGLSRLCAWLGHPYSEQMLSFHQANRTTGLEPAATMDWKQRTLQPVDASTVGRHAHVLPPAEADEFIAIARAQLQSYGYLP